MNTALEYSTRVVQEGGRRSKKSTLNDLVHLTPLRIPLMNSPTVCIHRSSSLGWGEEGGGQREDRGATVHKYSSFVHGGNSSQLSWVENTNQ
jgi:hypothetical protein